MRQSAGNIIVRANYLATAIFGPMLALIVAVYLVSAELASQTKDWKSIAWILLPTIFLFVLPGARAVRRVFADGTVIPPELVHERPVVAKVVTLAGGLGHFFFVLVMSFVFDIALGAEWPDDAGGPIVFLFSLSLLPYLISLLCGELALVGDGVSDAARGMRSGPIC
jgi:hypothetical protein